jgi:hypothetical protein
LIHKKSTSLKNPGKLDELDLTAMKHDLETGCGVGFEPMTFSLLSHRCRMFATARGTPALRAIHRACCAALTLTSLPCQIR